MEKIHALLIDDDKLNCESLKYLLEHDCEDVAVVGMVYGAEQARQFLKENKQQPDLIFLDINMPGETGFQFLASLPQRNFEVVFATAYDDYALQALKVSAVDYLVKPISIDDLQEALKKMRSKQKESNRAEEKELLENLLHNIQHPLQTKIALPYVGGVKFVELSEITHFEADSNYTIVHLSNLQKIVVSRVMHDFEDVVNPEQFLRIHKSYIVNLHYVKEYSGVQGGELILSDGNTIAFSKKYYEAFLSRMNEVALSLKRNK